MRKLSHTQNTARIILLVDKLNTETSQTFVNLGVKGLVSKDEPGRLLIQAINTVHKGELWLKRSETAEAFETLKNLLREKDSAKASKDRELSFGLTSRELQVVALVAEGLKNQEIAKRLGIKESTARHHLTSIFGKCSVTSRAALMLFAFRQGMVSAYQQE